MERHSEVGQDLFAFERCGKITDGTFLDIGCGDPTVFNNTFGLENIGWRGLLVEISPRWVGECAAKRKSPLLVEDATKLLDYEWIQVCAAVGLSSSIDYLSLDIDEHPEEGSQKELTVLKSLFDAGFRFRAITVEHDAYRLGDEPRASIRVLLLSQGYLLDRANVPYAPGSGHEFEDWWTRDGI